MKYIKFEGRAHKNSSDCWNDAIAYATGMPYDKVREMFKEFHNDNGGLDSRFFEAYLEKKQGFASVSYKFSDDVKVDDILQWLDTVNNKVVLTTTTAADADTNHVLYVHKNVAKDFPQKNYKGDYRVIGVFIKEVTLKKRGWTSWIKTVMSIKPKG